MPCEHVILSQNCNIANQQNTKHGRGVDKKFKV